MLSQTTQSNTDSESTKRVLVLPPELINQHKMMSNNKHDRISIQPYEGIVEAAQQDQSPNLRVCININIFRDSQRFDFIMRSLRLKTEKSYLGKNPRQTVS